jgi:type IX secretion system PorP/SprF family membrane protein
MNKKLLFALFVGMGMGMPARAQVYFQNTMYQYTQFAYNPAAAGITRPGLQAGANLSLLGRLQWLGIEGAPETSVLTFDTPLAQDFGNLGLMVAAERLGPWSNTFAQLAYAYEIPLGRFSLRIGASGGIKQVSVNPPDWIFPDDGDAVIPLAGRSVVVPMLNSGVYFSDSTFFVSLAGQNLLEPDIDELTAGVDPNNQRSTDPRTFSLAAGYQFRIDPRMSVQPAVMLISDFRGTPQTNLSVQWSYSPLTVGLNYRLIADERRGESLGAMLGVNVKSDLFIGYSYDYPLSGLNVGGDLNTHEIVLSYSFGALFGGGRKKNETDPLKKDNLDLR